MFGIQKMGVGLFVSVALACFGCGSSGEGTPSNGGSGGSGAAGGSGGSGGDCAAPAFDIAGTFNERYNCRNVDTLECVGENVFVVVVIDESDNGVDYTFENTGDMTVGTGKLCGNEFVWTSMSIIDDGYIEVGTWTFSDADNATIVSEFTSPGEFGITGECVGVATTGPDPMNAPPLECTSDFF